MSFETAVQTALFNALSTNLDIALLVSGVFDSVPDATGYPYITIGEAIHNEWDTDNTIGHQVSVTVHTWSRARGRAQTKAIQGEIYNALHRAHLTHPDYRFVGTDFEDSQTMMDADGLTRHGIQTFRIYIDKI